MSDKIKQTVNNVVLTGKVAEFKKSTGTEAKSGAPYISVEGVIQFGISKAESRYFKKYCHEYSVKEDGKKKENKAYPKVLEWANKVKSIADGSYEAATEVNIVGSFSNNDYVNKEEKLIEGIIVTPAFFNDVDGDYKGTADIEGYIQSIMPETKGEEKEETGRLRVTILTTDFFGNIIPVKNIIVPADLREGFEDGYEVGQTAKVYVDFVLNKAEPKPKKKGGLGVQRETEGKSYVEMILTGADPAIDEDEEGALSKEAVRIALSERKAMLKELEEKGYQGSNKSGKSISNASSNSKPAPVADDDMPF